MTMQPHTATRGNSPYAIHITNPTVVVTEYPEGWPDVWRVSAQMSITDDQGNTVLTWTETSVEEALRDIYVKSVFDLAIDVFVERDCLPEGIAARIYGVRRQPIELRMTEREYEQMAQAALDRHVQWCDTQPEAKQLREERAHLAL